MHYSNGIFVVTSDLKSGLINQNNEPVLPCEYEMIRPFRGGNGRVSFEGYVVKKSGELAIYDNEGKPVTDFSYDSWKAYFVAESEKYVDIVSRNGKWYLLDSSFNEHEIQPSP